MAADRGDFGARLRAAREARGISLKDIASATKISTLALEALERNDLSRLPGGLFSRAFVRAYAREVGLDPEQTVRDFVERVGESGDAAVVEHPVRTLPPAVDQPGLIRSGVGWLGLAITLVLVIVWIGVDRYFANRAQALPEPPAASAAAPPPAPKAPPLPIPELSKPPAAVVSLPPPMIGPRLETPAGQAPQSAASRPTPASAASQPTPSNAAQAGTTGAQAPGAARTPAPGQAAAATPPPGANGAVPAGPPAARPAADLPLRIVIAVNAPCWISAKTDDQRVAGRVLQAGEKLELSAARAVVLTTGNAGAMSYTVNGAPGRSLGGDGQAVTVVINTANYRTFVARNP